MSLSEYELLPEDEKKFYLESTLPRKKQEALQRGMQFVQRMTELKKRKVSISRFNFKKTYTFSDIFLYFI